MAIFESYISLIDCTFGNFSRSSPLEVEAMAYFPICMSSFLAIFKTVALTSSDNNSPRRDSKSQRRDNKSPQRDGKSPQRHNFFLACP